MCVCKSHPYDDAYSRYARECHDFGTVGDEVEQDWDDGLRSMVEFIPQHCREVAASTQRADIKTYSMLQPQISTCAAVKEECIK